MQPDLTDGKMYTQEDLMFWVKLRKKDKRTNKKRRDPLTAHRLLPGLQGGALHRALDFAIANNKWPCWFKVGDDSYDMVVPFTIAVWVSYNTTHTTVTHSHTHTHTHTHTGALRQRNDRETLPYEQVSTESISLHAVPAGPNGQIVEVPHLLLLQRLLSKNCRRCFDRLG